MVIYQIVNTRNSKVYIGSTCDPVARERAHFKSLRQNKHPNAHLQRAYNQEPPSFVFEILANTVNQFQDEESYIQLYDAVNNGYNMTPNAICPPSRKGLPPSNKLPRLQRLCECKCGGFVTYRSSNPKRFIHGHNAFGPKKTHCKWGHLRTKDTIASRGNCKICHRKY